MRGVKMSVAGVDWDNFTVVGEIETHRQVMFLSSSIPALQAAYEPQNVDIQQQWTEQHWVIKVREFRKDEEKDKVVYGPTLLYMEKVRFHDEKVRLEFNPNEQTEKSEELKEYFLDMLGYKSVSRADLAFDVHEDLSTYRFNQPGTSSILYLGRSSKLETLYIGARGSERQIRMYNKLKELAAHKKFHKLAELPKLPADWWRVEFQLRRDKSEDFVNVANDVLDGMHHVNDVDPTKVNAKDYALLMAFIDHPELLGQQSQYNRSKYRKLLNSVKKETSLSNALKETLATEKDRLVAERELLIQEYENS